MCNRHGKSPFNLLLWVNSILLSQGVIVNVTIINITTAIIFTMSRSVVVSSWPISPPPWPIPSWSLSPSFHEYRFCGIHCAAFFPRKSLQIWFLLFSFYWNKQTKNPKPRKGSDFLESIRWVNHWARTPIQVLFPLLPDFLTVNAIFINMNILLTLVQSFHWLCCIHPLPRNMVFICVRSSTCLVNNLYGY